MLSDALKRCRIVLIRSNCLSNLKYNTVLCILCLVCIHLASIRYFLQFFKSCIKAYKHPKVACHLVKGFFISFTVGISVNFCLWRHLWPLVTGSTLWETCFDLWCEYSWLDVFNGACFHNSGLEVPTFIRQTSLPPWHPTGNSLPPLCDSSLHARLWERSWITIAPATHAHLFFFFSSSS